MIASAAVSLIPELLRKAAMAVRPGWDSCMLLECKEGSDWTGSREEAGQCLGGEEGAPVLMWTWTSHPHCL